MRRALLVVTVFLILIVLMAACGGGGDGGSPDQVAKQWLEALAKGDKNALKDLTCIAQQESVAGTTGFLAGLGEEMGLDVSALSFTTTEQSEDKASLQVTGKIRMTLLGVEQEEEIDEAMPMVKEDGKWKVCD